MTPKGTLRYRLIESFQRHGLIGLINLVMPLAHIWIDKILVEIQTRLPFAYKRWQIEVEKGGSRSMEPVYTDRRVAYIYPRRIDANIEALLRHGISNSMFVFNTMQAGEPNPYTHIIPADNEGEFLSRCNELAQMEGIEWMVFTHPRAIHAAQLNKDLLSQDEKTVCVFWDEDYLSASGARENPFFKPAWSPELWLNLDILDTFALRTSFFSQALPQPSFAHLKAWVAGTQKPFHISQVWTHLNYSTSNEVQSRLAHHINSVSFYLQNLGVKDIDVRIEDECVLKTDWSVQNEKVSIVIPTRNNIGYLQRCLESLINKTDYGNYEIILVDNQSTDDAVLDYYIQLSNQYNNIRILPFNEVFNFSRACNRGAASADGSLLLFLNNDVEIIESGWLEELVRLVQLPGVGIAGARLFYPNGNLQHAGIVVGMTGHANHLGIKKKVWGKSPYGPANARRNISAVTGACMMVQSDVFLTINGFNENYHLVFNDVDICLRTIQAGWRIVFTPFANLIHHEGRSRFNHIPPEDISLSYHDISKWIEIGDPYYNPHLSLAITRPILRPKREMSSLRRLQNINSIFGG